jgi:hypothetical protein
MRPIRLRKLLSCCLAAFLVAMVASTPILDGLSTSANLLFLEDMGFADSQENEAEDDVSQQFSVNPVANVEFDAGVFGLIFIEIPSVRLVASTANSQRGPPAANS